MYKNYSVPALEAELSSLKKMKQLLKSMHKPENFTYIDIVNLHNYVDALERIVSEELDNRKSNNK